jgi:outer membrane protein assembly factor BamE (lipoprotein component of BamABCDE complex)
MEQLEEIHIGMTSRENVIKIIGYPTFESNFNKNVWIYYSYITKEILFFKPFIFEQRVLVLIFDEESDILRDMTLYNVNTNKYEILNLNTNYENNSDSIVKDILKNLGTFGVGK